MHTEAEKPEHSAEQVPLSIIQTSRKQPAMQDATISWEVSGLQSAPIQTVLTELEWIKQAVPIDK